LSNTRPDSKRERKATTHRMSDFMGKIRLFISETLGELRKCTWPGREELYESTVLVIVAITVLSTFVAIVDWISRNLIQFLTM
jgi:preprotein translocase subunit SecE